MLRLHDYRYHRPDRLSAALGLLSDEGAIPIAGGTDLMPNMKHGLFTPHHLVGLKGIGELRGIGYGDGEGNATGEEEGRELVIGACETLSAVAASPLVRRHTPSLAEAAGLVAGPQIRNSGTIGGNLCLDTRCTYYNQSHFWRKALGFCLKKDGEVCHVTKVGKKCVAAHSADTPPALLTLDAVVDLVSADGPRTVPLADWFVADGIWNSVRKPNELVRRIRVPLPGSGVRTAYRKVRQRKSIDFPLLSIAIATDMGEDGRVREMKMVVSALGSRPRVVAGLDKIATGHPLSEVADAVAGQAHRQSRPLENIIVDPEWRRAMVPIYVRRALREME